MQDKPITVEWQLPQGAGGMAAQMAMARLRGKLDRIARQHHFHVLLYHTGERYRVRCDLTEHEYTIICLQWTVKDSWDRWQRVSGSVA